MTVAELKTIWEPEAQGKVTNWNQVRGEFPDAKLGLFGAGTDSGTYDYYTFAINGKEHASRGDYTATEDDNITIQGVGGDKNAIGFLGLAYLTENAGKVKAVEIKQADGSCAKFLFDAKNQQELVSEVGYVALPAEAAGLALKKFEKRVIGSHFAGGSKVGVTVTDLVADAAN